MFVDRQDGNSPRMAASGIDGMLQSYAQKIVESRKDK